MIDLLEAWWIDNARVFILDQRSKHRGQSRSKGNSHRAPAGSLLAQDPGGDGQASRRK